MMKRLSTLFILFSVVLLNASELDKQRKSKLGEQIRYLCIIQQHYKWVTGEKHTRQAMENMWKNVSQCLKNAENANDILFCNELDKVRGLGSVLQQAQKDNDHQSMEKILEQVEYLGLLEKDLIDNSKSQKFGPAYSMWRIYKNVKKCRKTIDDRLICKQLEDMSKWADIIGGKK